ncbi:MAG: hypothetical protein Q9226_004364 [Calogaya cf. arnoldii]
MIVQTIIIGLLLRNIEMTVVTETEDFTTIERRDQAPGTDTDEALPYLDDKHLPMIATGHLEMDMVRMVPQETPTPGQLEMNTEASAIIDEGACPHPLPVDAIMWTETTQAIDRRFMIAGAEAEVEALNGEIARLTLALHQAEKSFWRECPWTF